MGSLSPLRSIVASIALLFLSSLAASGQDTGEFSRRRAEIRERYLRASEANDLEGMRAAHRELRELGLSDPDRAGAGAGDASGGGAAGSSGESGPGAVPSDPGLGTDGAVRPAAPREKPKSFFESLISMIRDLLGLGGPKAENPPADPPADPPAGETPPAKPRIEILSLTFKSDHGVLKDEAEKWTNTGSKFPEPEWTADGDAHPISHTMGRAVELRVDLDSSRAASGKVVGVGPDGLRFEAAATLAAGRSSVAMTSSGKLPERVEKFDFQIRWTFESDGGDPISLGSTGTHTAYLTMDAPREGGEPEDGATVKRMERAVTWLDESGSLDPHDIVDHLFSKYEMYVLGIQYLPERLQKELEADPDKRRALEDAGFATYKKSSVGGAWPLAEWQRYGGECQAIVRLIRGVLTQAGVPGKAQPKYVNADARAPYTAVVKDSGSACTGPDPKKIYALADSEIAVGEYHDDEKRRVGWNNYEAYLRFEHGGRMGWLGGGVGRLPDKYDPLNVFFGLAALERVYENGGSKLKVAELWKYREHSWDPYDG